MKEKSKESTIYILENYSGFSKQDHQWWTTFADQTRAYDPKTLELVDTFDDAYFPMGMGAIEGWALSNSWMEYRHDYTYILAECEEYHPPDDANTEPSESHIVTVMRSLWLPLHHWLYKCNLRENPPTGEGKERFLRAIRTIIHQRFGRIPNEIPSCNSCTRLD